MTHGFGATQALFAAAFSPPHAGHMEMIDTVIENTDIECVILLPSGDAYNKPGLLCARDRLALLALATKDRRDHTTMSTLDIERTEHPLSLVSARACKRHYAPNAVLPWIVGVDRLHWLACQGELDAIVEEFPLVVFDRHDLTIDDVTHHPAISRAAGRIATFPVPECETSSRTVRRGPVFATIARTLGITWTYAHADTPHADGDTCDQ